MKNQYINNNSSDSDEVELRELILFVWQGRWLIASVTLITILIGAAYILFTPKTFTASLEIYPITNFDLEPYIEFNALNFFKKESNSLLQEFSKKESNSLLDLIIKAEESDSFKSYFEIDKDSLLNSLIETIQYRTVFIDAFKATGYVPRDAFDDENEYNAKVKDMAYDVRILPPTVQNKKRKAWTLQFEGKNAKGFIPALDLALRTANKKTRKTLENRFRLYISEARRKNAFMIKDLQVLINNAKQDYIKETKNRLFSLKEQAKIFQELDTKKIVQTKNTGKDTVIGRSYEAIEEEIVLIESRDNPEAFVPALLELESKIRQIKQNPKISRSVAAFNKTPIATGRNFQSAILDVAAIEIKEKTKPTLILILSAIIGLMFSLVFLFIKNTLTRNENNNPQS